MLVLTRKVGERIRLGTSIEVVVVEVRGNKVRLGIEAPADVKIIRSELPALPDDQLPTRQPSCPAR